MQSLFQWWTSTLGGLIPRHTLNPARVHRGQAASNAPTMDALSSFLADPWATIAAYWQAVPSHVRIIISFLITRTVSGIIRRAVATRAADRPPSRGPVVDVT